MPQLQDVDASTTAAELLGLQGLELAAASFVAGGLLVALLCGAGILVCRCRSRRAARGDLDESSDPNSVRESRRSRTSMVAITPRAKAAAPLTSTTPPRPGPRPPVAPPAPPSLPPDWEQHETDEGEAYYYNRVTRATRWDHP